MKLDQSEKTIIEMGDDLPGKETLEDSKRLHISDIRDFEY